MLISILESTQCVLNCLYCKIVTKLLLSLFQIWIRSWMSQSHIMSLRSHIVMIIILYTLYSQRCQRICSYFSMRNGNTMNQNNICPVTRPILGQTTYYSPIGIHVIRGDVGAMAYIYSRFHRFIFLFPFQLNVLALCVNILQFDLFICYICSPVFSYSVHVS